MRLKHLNRAGTWPSGNPRLYYRPKGQKAQRLPDLPMGHPEFLAAYAKAAGLKEPPHLPARTGTIGAAVEAFLASDRYLSTSDATRAVWRRALDAFRIKYGSGVLADLRAQHIRADLAKLKPHPANSRLKVWRAAGKWWAEVGLIPSDPSEGIARRRIAATEGHKAWTGAEVAAYRAHWPLGTPQRLAFETLHWIGSRMGDTVGLSEGMVDRDGWLTFRQSKTGGRVSIPVRCPAPDFAEPDGQAQFLAALDARPERHAVLIVTAFGKPRSVKAASSWFAAAARAAGVMGKSAHGLRKYRATMMAENGATAHQLAAWLGHESLSEVQHYAKAADRKRILAGAEGERESSSANLVVPNFGKLS